MAMTKYEKQAKEYMDPYRKEALGDKLKLYQKKAQDTRKLYDTQIFETGRAYEDEYRENAVQKAINERQVAESMANMGLTDSGLNRTQQTAVNLSYANAKAGIDKTKRQAIDNIELQKTSDLSTIRQNWLADKAAINQTYDKYEADYVGDLEDAAAKRYAAYIKNQNNSDTPVGTAGIILENGWNLDKGMQGDLDSNNISIMPKTDENGDVTGYTYTDKNTKKSTFVPLGVNPFTGDDNYVKYKAVAETANDFFENGYQPKKVYVDGKNYGYVSDSGIKAEINGNKQRVHKTVDKETNEENYWLWDRNHNIYVKYEPKHVGVYEDVSNWGKDEWYSCFIQVYQKYNRKTTLETYKQLRPFMSSEVAAAVGKYIGGLPE